MKTTQNIEIAPHTESAPIIIGSLSKRRITGDVAVHTFLAIMVVIWLVSIAWVLVESFNKDTVPFTKTFSPVEFSLDNYVKLFTDRTIMDFPRMYLNTFIITCFTCIISVFFVLMVAYTMGHMRFRSCRTFMSVVLILGMFPGIMAVSVAHFILKAIGMTGGDTTILALTLVYSAGSGVDLYAMKGHMDIIPSSLDEAAILDGCTRSQMSWKVILPICKPMIAFQAITSFLGPWLDSVMAEVIACTQSDYTVALGLWLMPEKEYTHNWSVRSAAGAVLVSIPIAILFITMQHFYQESTSGSTKG